MPLLTHTRTELGLLGGCCSPCYKDILWELMEGHLPSTTAAFHGSREKIIISLAATTLLTQKWQLKPHFVTLSR